MRKYDEPTKVLYLVLWTGDPGTSLVDKWTEEDRPVKEEDLAKLSPNEKRGKLDSSSLESYWTLFNTIVEHIIGLPISLGRPMVFHSLFQKMSQNLPVYLQMYPPLPPQNETVNRVPNSKPPPSPK